MEYKCEGGSDELACNETPELMVEGSLYCEKCGIEAAIDFGSSSSPIVTVDQIKEMTQAELNFLEPDTVLIDTDSDRSFDLFTHADLDKTQNLVAENGMTMYREPIGVAHCLYCEAVCIGHVNKVGGWLARHRHFHETYSDSGDISMNVGRP